MDAQGETVELADGRTVRIRPVRPEDKGYFSEGIERASEETRRMRFFLPKQRFTQSELAYLTEVDGVDHVALGAISEPPDAEPVGIGVGRYVRDPERPHVAEAALAVRDDFQSQGLGRLLLERLTELARANGVQRLEFYLLVENARAEALLRDLFPSLVTRQEGALYAAYVDL